MEEDSALYFSFASREAELDQLRTMDLQLQSMVDSWQFGTDGDGEPGGWQTVGKGKKRRLKQQQQQQQQDEQHGWLRDEDVLREWVQGSPVEDWKRKQRLQEITRQLEEGQEASFRALAKGVHGDEDAPGEMELDTPPSPPATATVAVAGGGLAAAGSQAQGEAGASQQLSPRAAAGAAALARAAAASPAAASNPFEALGLLEGGEEEQEQEKQLGSAFGVLGALELPPELQRILAASGRGRGGVLRPSGAGLPAASEEVMDAVENAGPFSGHGAEANEEALADMETASSGSGTADDNYLCLQDEGFQAAASRLLDAPARGGAVAVGDHAVAASAGVELVKAVPEDVTAAAQLNRPLEQLLELDDVSMMSRQERQTLYLHWQEQLSASWADAIQRLVEELVDLQGRLDELFAEAENEVNGYEARDQSKLG